MEKIKIGDNVRYLNAVGGGRVVRIAGDIVYVDEDGFETPVLARECVVVGQVTKFNNPVPQAASSPKAQKPAPAREDTPAPTVLPVVETKGGDSMNVVLGFEATDLKALSQASFDAYIVNDSNYYIYLSVACRAAEDTGWTMRYDGLIEPNIQEFIGEFMREDLPAMDRILVQFVAFKRDKSFEVKPVVSTELRVDTTKFARLHCFRPNPYFDEPVIAFDIVCNDRIVREMTITKEDIRRIETADSKETYVGHRQKRPVKVSADEPLVIDLHIDELVDTTAGLSPADMLNLQIDRFSRVMDENLRHVGRRIVFIHGKGEGVLRQAILKELKHRYKGHDVQDASFREYGFGATQVTIKNIPRR